MGGSIESIALGGRRFPVDAEADVDIKLGGFENETKPNGDGSYREIKKRMLAALKAVSLSVDNSKDDQEYIQTVADTVGGVDTVITLNDGTVYSGKMSIVGEFTYKTKDSVCEIELSGTLEKQ